MRCSQSLRLFRLKFFVRIFGLFWTDGNFLFRSHVALVLFIMFVIFGLFPDECNCKFSLLLRLALFPSGNIYELFCWKQHKCYIVATCDRDLKRRIRKVWSIDNGLTLSQNWSPILCETGFWYIRLLIYWQVPGVPIMYITQHKYSVERLPEATVGGGRLMTNY